MSCLKCNKVFIDDSCCECDGCKLKIHYTCADLTASEIKCIQLKTKRTLKFFCDICLEGLRLIPVLQRQLNNLETKFDDILKKMGDDQTKNVDSISSTEPLFNIEAFVAEMEDRKIRANNLMVYNLKECDSNSVEEKAKQDANEITKIIAPTFTENIKKVIRIGKHSNITRPVKVIFNSSNAVLETLKNKNKITYPNIKVSSDLTLNQRNYLKKLRDQLEQRKSKGESNITIKYIHGVPKIIKTKEASQKN